KDIPHQSAVLALIEPAPVPGDDAGGILSPVLEHREGIIEILVDALPADDAHDSAHLLFSPPLLPPAPGPRYRPNQLPMASTSRPKLVRAQSSSRLKWGISRDSRHQPSSRTGSSIGAITTTARQIRA